MKYWLHSALEFPVVSGILDSLSWITRLWISQAKILRIREIRIILHGIIDALYDISYPTAFLSNLHGSIVSKLNGSVAFLGTVYNEDRFN